MKETLVEKSCGLPLNGALIYLCLARLAGVKRPKTLEGLSDGTLMETRAYFE